ncbi:hypothetical protein CDL15_Pgr011337 [Punica granatum]|uniref:Uncharacterized protein n=1 Tax=Punica granatum TaxID=22663 RepID=A0A218WFT0_PUNGR|nr:hypothetical protein CDL15_Pgr011337 [Punica granatum]
MLFFVKSIPWFTFCIKSVPALSFPSTSNGRANVARGEIVGHICHVGATSARPLDVDGKDNARIDLMQKVNHEVDLTKKSIG